MKMLLFRFRRFVRHLKRQWNLGRPWEAASEPAFLLTVQEPGSRWTGLPWRTFRQAGFSRDESNREHIAITFDHAVVMIEGSGIEPLMSDIAAHRLERIWDAPSAQRRHSAGPCIHHLEVHPRLWKDAGAPQCIPPKRAQG